MRYLCTMGKKKKKRISTDGMVYSTDPDFDFEEEEEFEEDLDPNEQHLVVRRDKKQRKGKVVTLVQGFEGSSDSLKQLAQSLKTHCGTGGSAKDGEIIIQGNLVDKVYSYLLLSGYNVKKIG